MDARSRWIADHVELRGDLAALRTDLARYRARLGDGAAPTSLASERDHLTTRVAALRRRFETLHGAGPP